MLLGTRDAGLITLAILLAYNLGPTAMFAVQATFFSELFGPTVRYTGLSIAYQVSAIHRRIYAADCRVAAAGSDTT
jgi:MFS transporter, MHS family, shikimate and dehydroshikimate transport protein